MKIAHVADTLRTSLRWPIDAGNHEEWRAHWSKPFRHRIGHVIRTADALAESLATLARRIRDAANVIMAHESEKGALRQLFKAFQIALIHDLTEEDFADTYAQTITYGLLTAAISRTEMSAGRYGTALFAENVTEMVPITNPFLREMLQTFLKAGGRKGGIDFDELGIQDVVELLRGDETDLPSILRDFGNRNLGEDPVIHFYEHFLAAYNKKLKVKRGVFYTPRPVVSYIVRSVHELLQTEFGLEDGLASTVSWHEMALRNEDLKIPEGTDQDSPFVVILDPATGTATFLVEVIDVIYNTMNARWSKDGLNDEDRKAAWNKYVPSHLLPRLFGFELMMAPYAIAHMKIGLKLHETGYSFGSDKRAQIYLTNALEPASDSQQVFQGIVPALAHEAQAVDKVKRYQRFTVIIGNPPYSINSSNSGQWIKRLSDDYYFVDGKPLHERNPKVLQDDYVKFMRLAQFYLTKSIFGIMGYITNHGYIDNPTFRGQRQNIASSFDIIGIMDLHGNSRKRERSSDDSVDENVFDIMQGVALLLGVCKSRSSLGKCIISHSDLCGKRDKKYQFLSTNSLSTTKMDHVAIMGPFYSFTPMRSLNNDEYLKAPSYTEIYSIISNGFKTHRDHVAIDFDRAVLKDRIESLRESYFTDDYIRRTFHIDDGAAWVLSDGRKCLNKIENWEDNLKTSLYRPFDFRSIFYHESIVDRPRKKSMWHMEHPNIGIIVGRQGQAVGLNEWDLQYCGRFIADTNLFYRGGIAYAPLYIYYQINDADLNFDGEKLLKRNNFKSDFLTLLSKTLGLSGSGNDGMPNGLIPEDIFYYNYAVFYSPSFRHRYAEFLKIDFPRLPLTGSFDLFQALALLGGKLVALHLMENDWLPITTYDKYNDGDDVVEKVWYDPIDEDGKGCVWINQTRGFHGVPYDVWQFHIGGYQVCEKWLKDRKGRILSPEDIEHYQYIVYAISETIRLMGEIDELIEQYGGWPGAFQSATGGQE